MATVLQLGAIAWVNQNRFTDKKDRAKQLEVDLLDFITDSNAIGRLRTLTGITNGQLEELGREAMARGCSKDHTEKEFEIVPGLIASLLRRPKRRWRSIDGTVFHSVDDDQHRYLEGCTWDRNSCAIDAGIQCGILLDAGRIQLDQISPSKRARLIVPAQIFRQLVATKWGLMEQFQRDGLRDILANVLAVSDPVAFPRHGFIGAGEVLLKCLDDLPQLSFSDIRASICCDGIVGTSADQVPTRRTGYILPGIGAALSAEVAMNSILVRRSVERSLPCTRGRECTGPTFRVIVILDRMPPVLMVQTPKPISEQDNEVWRLFDPLDVSYDTTLGRRNIRYLPLGCVMMVNGNHFLVRWRMELDGRDQIMQHDGQVSSRMTTVQSWWAGLGGSRTRKAKQAQAGVVTMFYRQA